MRKFGTSKQSDIKSPNKKWTMPIAVPTPHEEEKYIQVKTQEVQKNIIESKAKEQPQQPSEGLIMVETRKQEE